MFSQMLAHASSGTHARMVPSCHRVDGRPVEDPEDQLARHVSRPAALGNWRVSYEIDFASRAPASEAYPTPI
jgi:hypothetical protein